MIWFRRAKGCASTADSATMAWQVRSPEVAQSPSSNEAAATANQRYWPVNSAAVGGTAGSGCFGASGGVPRKAGTNSLMNLSDSRRILDRKSTRLNSSHQIISYAVFCLKK